MGKEIAEKRNKIFLNLFSPFPPFPLSPKSFLLIFSLIFSLSPPLFPRQSLAGSFSVGESARVSYQGSLGVAQWYFPEKGLSRQPDRVTTVRGEVDVTVQTDSSVEFKINPRFVHDPDNEDRNRVKVDDLYMDSFSERFEARVGYQIFSWKTVESVSQADFLNQQDREIDFFEEEKLGEPSLRLRYIVNFEKEHVLELYYLPWFTPTSLPVGKNRFSFFNQGTGEPLDISNDEKDHLYDSPEKRRRPQGAVRYQSTFYEDFDFSMFYFNGYERFPLLTASISSTAFYHYYPLVHKGGLTFQGVVENWLLKGEGVYTAYMNEIRTLNNSLSRPAYLAYTVGFEYTFYSVAVQNHDIGTIVEFIGDTDAYKDADDLEGYRPFRHHLFGGVRYTFNNASDRSLLAGGIVDYYNRDVVYQVEVEERVANNFMIRFAYNDIRAGDESQLRQFEASRRVTGELSFYF